MANLRASSVALFLMLCACGGKVDDGGEPGSGDEEGSPSDTPADTEPPSKPPGVAQPGDTPLGECRRGFDPAREPERSCDWLAEGRCYATKLAACACVCPRDRNDSFCASDFFNGPNGRTEVSCF